MCHKNTKVDVLRSWIRWNLLPTDIVPYSLNLIHVDNGNSMPVIIIIIIVIIMPRRGGIKR